MASSSKTAISTCWRRAALRWFTALVVFARFGDALRSFASYSARGITIAMGTDTNPPDLVDNMRQGLNICRVVDGGETASAAEFYNAATLGGAKALGRSDIGR